MKQLQIFIEVLFLLKRYNHIKCTPCETLQIMIAVLFLLKRYNHIKSSTYETVADNDIEDIYLFEVHTKYISSSVLKTSGFS